LQQELRYSRCRARGAKRKDRDDCLFRATCAIAGGGFEPPTFGLWARKARVFLTLFKSTTYVLLSVEQGLNEIVMMTMVITDFATFCYSPARMQPESLPHVPNAGRCLPFPIVRNTPETTCPLPPLSHMCRLLRAFDAEFRRSNVVSPLLDRRILPHPVIARG